MASTRTQAWEQAVRSFGLDPGPRVRPNPLRWLWYCVWGPLPERHRGWVLYDATCATWLLRHIVRILVAAALPVAAIAIFLPANGGIRALTAFVTGACAVLFTALYSNEGTEHRLVQAGWPWGVGPAVRERRARLTQQIATGRRRERAARR